jgi:lipopolysaccharide/colanic/teichoic acid biosynthesis glycosyltransferase
MPLAVSQPCDSSEQQGHVVEWDCRATQRARSQRGRCEDSFETTLMTLPGPRGRSAPNRSMRLLDVSLSLIALAVLSPVLLLAALAVKCSSPGPILYRARRVGKDGRLFDVYKFRTMLVDAASHGPALTRSGDTRVTGVGRFLRRSKIDELPQLFNVLTGSMSLVGPRPEDPRYVKSYSQDQLRVLRVRPGITSPATILHRHEERILTGPDWETRYRNEILPEKVQMELNYLSRRTLSQDLLILVQTAVALFR